MGISGEWIGDYFGIGWGDFNNDGATDLFAAGHIDKYRLFRNDNCPGNFLNINLIGTVSTYNAVGAMVVLWAEGESITRWVHGGEGKHDFSSFNLEFGLDDKTLADSLIVYWPAGTENKMFNIEANQFLTITEGLSPINPEIVATPNDTVGIYDTIILNVGIGYSLYQWQDGSGDSLFIATNMSGVNGGEQVYWVEVTDQNGCSGTDTISVWFLPFTQIDKNKTGISFKVYPNPATDKISISFGDITGDVEMQILTTFGKVVYNGGLKQVRHNYIENVDISFLPSGIFFIRLISPDGKISGISKFVK